MARDRHPSAVPSAAATTVVLAAALSLAGCAVSFPVAGFVDKAPTGSIEAGAAKLSPDLDKEDWRRAKAALAVALDPQGNGAEAAWHNPLSGARGSFAALAPPFASQDRICRAFTAKVVAGKQADRRLDGSACRTPDGDWVLAEITAEADKARPMAARRSK